MTLNEIIAEIDEKCPNSLIVDSKVRKINKLQKKMFRTIVKNTVGTTFNLIKDQAQYLLTCHPNAIRELIVDHKMYTYRQIEAEAIGEFFYILKGNGGYYIGLYPTPTEDKVNGMTIFHYESPTELTSSNLGATPDLEPAFHDALVYGVCQEIAEIEQRYDKAAAFKSNYEYETGEFLEANQDTEPSEIQMEWR